MDLLIEQEVGYTDPDFGQFRTENLRLSLCFSRYRFAFCITHKDDGRLLLLESFSLNPSRPGEDLTDSLVFSEQNMDGLLSLRSWFSKPFEAVMVLYHGPGTTLVPAVFFEAQEMASMHSLLLDQEENTGIVSDFLQAMNMYQVYAIPELLVAKLNNLFTGYHCYHFSTCLLANFLVEAEKQDADFQLYLHVNPADFQFLVLQQGQVVLYNTFTWQVPEDVRYYLLNAMSELGVNPRKAVSVLAGEIHPGSDLFNMLAVTLPSPGLLRKPARFQTGREYNGLPYHTWFNLINSWTCVS